MLEYNNLSENELQAVISNATKALNNKKVQKQKEVKAKIKALASSIGISVRLKDNDSQSYAQKAKAKSVPPKYRNPNDGSQTWTGRGIAPKWMQELNKSGRDKSEFLIKH